MSDIDLRASDAERDRAAERLRAATVEGRLSADELEERLERALRARTRAELDAVLADLPASRPKPPRPRPAAKQAELRTFLATSFLLVAIWALTGAGYFWPVWPILGWGLFAVPWVRVRPCRRNASRRHSTTRWDASSSPHTSTRPSPRTTTG